MLVGTGSGIEFKAGAAGGESVNPPAAAEDDAVDAGNPGFALLLAAVNQPVVMATFDSVAAETLTARAAADSLPGRTLPSEGRLLPLHEFSPALAGADDDDGLGQHGSMLATAARLGGHASGDPLASVFGQLLLRKEPGGAELGLITGLSGPSVRTGAPAAVVSTGQGGVSLSPQEPGFDQALAQRVLVFIQQGSQHVRVRVHPEHLGPIEIRIRMETDGLQVSMASPHAVVREALESALPRLRDALAEQGLDLGHAEVGNGERDAQRQRGDSARDFAAGEDAVLVGDTEADSPVRAVAPTPSYRLIDTFA